MKRPSAPVAPASSTGSKRAKLLSAQHVVCGLAAIVTPQEAVAHPFEALAEDAAETPVEAYRDIEPLLFRIAQAAGRTKATLRIWDPFFAAGSVCVHLRSLGFESVINRNEDFYAVCREGRAPPFDVLVTNPPFSQDHIARTLDFAERCGKPFFLLLPEFIEEKGYYRKYAARARGGAEEAAPATSAGGAGGMVSAGGSGGARSSSGGGGGGGAAAAAAPPALALSAPLYVGPRFRPYQFSAPGRDLAGAKPFVERTHYAALPFQVFACAFQCVWYCQLGPQREAALAWWRKKYERQVPAAMADSAAALPQLSKAAKAKARGEGAAAGAAGAAGAGASAPAGAAAAPDLSRNAWRKKLSRQRKKSAREALGDKGGA